MLIIFLAALGSLLEYYDFIIYGLSAPFLAQNFFPQSSALSATLNSLAIFAMGYFIRPLGGALLGSIADRHGRKSVFLSSIFLMAIATFSIGLLPTYQQIGLAAPLLLIFCRLIQGIALGGELPGAVTYITEHLLFKKTGLATGILASFLSLGTLSATVLLSLLQHEFFLKNFSDVIWRIPFIIGGLFGLISFWLRRRLLETPLFKTYLLNNTVRSSILTTLKQHRLQLFYGFAITVFPAIIVIIALCFPSLLHQNFHYSFANIYQMLILGQIMMIILMPLFGLLSDKISAKRLLQIVLLLFSGCSYFLFQLLMPNSYIHLLLFGIFYHLFMALFVVTYLPILPTLFPTAIRFSGVAWCYNLSYVVAGSIPWLLTHLLSEHYNSIPLLAFGLSFFSCIIFIITFITKLGRIT